MQFSILLALLPTLISFAAAAPAEATALNVESTEKICLIHKCLGKSNNKPGCNIDQCISAAAPTVSTCFKAINKPKADVYDKVQCATTLLALGGNMPGTCKDCIGQLGKLISGITIPI